MATPARIRPALQPFITAITTPTVIPAEEPITVSSATKRIAFAYERFRNTLEPDEEDILRRKAIWRILDRRLDEDRPPLVIATALVQELIRAHYIEPVGASYAKRVAEQLQRTMLIRHALPNRRLDDWLLQLTAVSLDRLFYPRQAEEILITTMYQDSLSRVVWTDELIAPADRATQLYIAAHRALFASDDLEISYHYFIHQFPAWHQAEFTPADAAAIAAALSAFHRELTQITTHPARERLTRLMRPVAVPYRIIRDIARTSGEAAFTDSAALQQATAEAITKRMQRIRERMSRRAWHSILFLFLTKTLIAVLVEVPYETIFLGQAQWLALAVNIAFHPLLLFGLTVSARLPGQRNTEALIEQVQKVISDDTGWSTVVINASRRYGALTWSLFTLFYAVLFMGIFWSLFSLLDILDFSLLAMFIFVIFLGLVSFLAIRIRRSVNDIRVIPRHEGAVSVIFSFLTLPVLEFGRWLAQNITQLNVVLFVMDQILEAPFKLLIDITEEWFSFVRDRQEEIV